MQPLEFRITPPYPAGPGLPLAAPSKLSLKVPKGGRIQSSGLEMCTDLKRAIELSGGNSSNLKSCKILHSLLSTLNSSCDQDCKVIVSFICLVMVSHISSGFLALFSIFFLFLVFHISQIVKPVRSSHKRFTILFLKLLVGHSAMVRFGLPLCLLSLLKMVAPLSHKAVVTLHSSSKWLIVSTFSSHKQHRDGPIKPLACKLSQVRR